MRRRRRDSGADNTQTSVVDHPRLSRNDTQLVVIERRGSCYAPEPDMTRIVPVKHTLEVPNSHGVITWNVTCTCAPTRHPSVMTPLSTAFPVWLFCFPAMSAVKERSPLGSVTS